MADTENKPWFPPEGDVRPDGFECLAWHRGRWRHVKWTSTHRMWMFGYGSAGFMDLGRAFAPLPWNTPDADFWQGENS